MVALCMEMERSVCMHISMLLITGDLLTWNFSEKNVYYGTETTGVNNHGTLELL